jgi:hypothetical protein
MDERTANRTSLARSITIAWILVIGSLNAHAQFEVVTLANPINARTLSGRVKDQTGIEIEGAKVDLLDVQTEETLTSTMTDSKGSFHFKDFGKSTYKLKIAKPGFNILQVTIRIRKHAPALVVLKLPIAA